MSAMARCVVRFLSPRAVSMINGVAAPAVSMVVSSTGIGNSLAFSRSMWLSAARRARIYGARISRLPPIQCGSTRAYSAAAEAVSDRRGLSFNGHQKEDTKSSESEYSFYADEDVNWSSLGLSNEIAEAANRAGFERPSAIQAAAVPRILEGGDVVVAAETGSGKTHAYLLPIFELLAKSREVFKLRRAEEKTFIPLEFALILCPNATLCQQAAEMASGICSNLREPLKMAIITGGQGWPTSQPDIVIATPAAIINNLFAFDPKRNRKTAFVRDARYVVFDEADMLLSGGFAREVNRLIPMFKLQEKRLAAAEKANQTPDKEPVQPWTDFQPQETEDQQSASEDDADVEDEVISEWVDEVDDADNEIAAEGGNEDKKEDSIKKDKRRRRFRKATYKRSKQYIFVAATLPDTGKKTPGAMLAHQFPDAKWVNGNFLHCRNPRVEHRWVEVEVNTRVEALLQAVTGRPDLTEANSNLFLERRMVFGNSVESVNAIAKIFLKVGISSMCYHRDIPQEERTSNLKKFQHDGGILMCTDSAARGLDIPNIGHVIQAEFALSAIDFLHRVGRTGRAGNTGLVTSLYTEANRPLVEAVRQAMSSGQPVEGAFSRKRSFRNKLKKLELQQAQVKDTASKDASPN